MDYQNLSIETKDRKAIVTVNRPKAMNALNAQTMKEIDSFFDNEARDPDIWGIVITGAGDKAFIAGADIKEFMELDREKGQAMATRGQEIFSKIEHMNKPVIAAVNGFALGGGCELAMACHLRVASEKARFGQPEVNLGTIPGYGGTQRLTQYIGKGKAFELLMTGDMITANEAYDLGLVNHVAPPDSLLDYTHQLLDKILSKGPLAIAKVIESVNAYFRPPKNT